MRTDNSLQSLHGYMKKSTLGKKDFHSTFEDRPSNIYKTHQYMDDLKERIAQTVN